MALVKLVEDERRHAAQLGVANHLPQQQALGDEADAGAGAGDIFEADLVANLAAQAGPPLPGDPRRQQPRRQPPRLQDDHLALPQDAPLQEHLGDLGGFARAGGRGHDQASRGLQAGQERLFEFVDWQPFSHGRHRLHGPRRFWKQGNRGDKCLGSAGGAC